MTTDTATQTRTLQQEIDDAGSDAATASGLLESAWDVLDHFHFRDEQERRWLNQLTSLLIATRRVVEDIGQALDRAEVIERDVRLSDVKAKAVLADKAEGRRRPRKAVR